MLRALFDNDAASVRVIDALIHLHVHTANRVHQCHQFFEVDFRIVRYLDVAQLACLADGASRTTKVIGGVELVLPVSVDLDARVARNGHHRHQVLRRIDPHDDVRIGTRTLNRTVLAPIRADEHHVERLGEIARNLGRKRIGDSVELLLGFRPAVQLIVDRVDVQRERRPGTDDRHQNGGHHAQRDLLPTTRPLRRRRSVARIRARVLARRALTPVHAIRAATLTTRSVCRPIRRRSRALGLRRARSRSNSAGRLGGSRSPRRRAVRPGIPWCHTFSSATSMPRQVRYPAHRNRRPLSAQHAASKFVLSRASENQRFPRPICINVTRDRTHKILAYRGYCNTLAASS